MAESIRIEQSTDDRLLHLRKELEKYHEGSFEYVDIQRKIDRIVAEKYLQYVNR